MKSYIRKSLEVMGSQPIYERMNLKTSFSTGYGYVDYLCVLVAI